MLYLNVLQNIFLFAIFYFFLGSNMSQFAWLLDHEKRFAVYLLREQLM